MSNVRLTTEEFITRAKSVHGDRFDYSATVYKSMNKKAGIICRDHGEFEQTPLNHLNGQQCPTCAQLQRNNSKRLGISGWVEKFRESHGDKFDYRNFTTYTRASDKIKIICPVHGESEQIISDHANGHGCRKCSVMISNGEMYDETKECGLMKKCTTEQFIKAAKVVHGETYDYSEVVYMNNSTKVKILCRVHGIFEQIPNGHLEGKGCRACALDKKSETNRQPLEDFIRICNEIHNGFYDYSKVAYRNKESKITIICPVHGEFTNTPAGHKSGIGCQKCRKENTRGKRLTTEMFVEKAVKIHGDKYDYSKSDYKGTYENIEIVCKKHGSFFQRPNMHLCGQGCSVCGGFGPSTGENEVFEFVSSLSPSVEQSNRKILKGKELDIYDPEQRIAIEYNGLYWHSSGDTLTDSKASKHHWNKTELCDQENIRLFHINENEWFQKQDIWKSVLKNAFGKTDQKIFARKCEIVEISHNDSIAFLEENHLQGQCVAKYRYGLMFEGELVSVMTFGASRYNKKFDFELLRFCNKINTNVVGGASRLLKHFRKLHEGSIISYANRRWSVGGLYLALGFQLTGETEPNYNYFKINEPQVYHRSSFMKHKLKDKLENFNPELSEVENMYNHGYRRIWDCGNFVFKLD